MAEYEVAPKGAVSFRGRVYTAGMKIPGLPPRKLNQHLASGYMVECNSIGTLIHPGTLAPGTTNMIPIGEDGMEGSAKPIEVHNEVPKSAVEVTQTTPDSDVVPETKAAKQGSLWALDPDGIRGKGLDELNVLIAERADDVKPFETVEEATAFLSQDYKEPAFAE